MPTSIDYLSGKAPAALMMHLSTKPFPSPFKLTPDLEADFAGYRPFVLNSFLDMDNVGYTYFFGANAKFTNNTDAPIILTGAWITATPPGGQPGVVAIVGMAGSAYQLLPIGDSWFSARLMYTVLPEGWG